MENVFKFFCPVNLIFLLSLIKRVASPAYFSPRFAHMLSQPFKAFLAHIRTHYTQKSTLVTNSYASFAHIGKDEVISSILIKGSSKIKGLQDFLDPLS